MMTELSGHLSDHKFKELSVCLEHTDSNTALAAEAELAVLWAISQVAHIVPEPVLPNSSHRPDAASENLFASGASVIEVRALSDDSFSGKEAMDRTANIIAGYADHLRTNAGDHLYFEFNERSYWTNRFHRERCVDPSFELDNNVKTVLRRWITAPDWPNPERIRICYGKTDVVISWKKSTVRLYRTFCRMPSVAYHLEDNPVYKALKKKSKQVRGADASTRRCIVLVDVGCDLLRRLRPMGRVHEIGGGAIIHHALRKLSIDTVIVLSPFRRWEFGLIHRSEMLWNVTCFDRREAIPAGEYERIERMAAQLPRPQFEGYQARDLHKQGRFAADRNDWYLPTYITTDSGGGMTIKLSAALLHEYLAGRVDAEKFQKEVFHKEENFFEMELTRGHSIRQVQFEPGGTDEDDDYVIIELDTDWEKIARKRPASPSSASP